MLSDILYSFAFLFSQLVCIGCGVPLRTWISNNDSPLWFTVATTEFFTETWYDRSTQPVSQNEVFTTPRPDSTAQDVTINEQEDESSEQTRALLQSTSERMYVVEWNDPYENGKFIVTTVSAICGAVILTSIPLFVLIYAKSMKRPNAPSICGDAVPTRSTVQHQPTAGYTKQQHDCGDSIEWSSTSSGISLSYLTEEVEVPHTGRVISVINV